MLVTRPTSVYRHRGSELHSQRVRSLEGYDFPGRSMKDKADEQVARTKTEIIEVLQRSGDAFATFLDGLSEDALGESVSMPGGQSTKSRLEMLLSVKEHEMHHRGQLMLIERQLGIVPHLTREREARFGVTRQPPAQTVRLDSFPTAGTDR